MSRITARNVMSLLSLMSFLSTGLGIALLAFQLNHIYLAMGCFGISLFFAGILLAMFISGDPARYSLIFKVKSTNKKYVAYFETLEEKKAFWDMIEEWPTPESTVDF